MTDQHRNDLRTLFSEALNDLHRRTDQEEGILEVMPQVASNPKSRELTRALFSVAQQEMTGIKPLAATAIPRSEFKDLKDTDLSTQAEKVALLVREPVESTEDPLRDPFRTTKKRPSRGISLRPDPLSTESSLSSAQAPLKLREEAAQIDSVVITALSCLTTLTISALEGNLLWKKLVAFEPLSLLYIDLITPACYLIASALVLSWLYPWMMLTIFGATLGHANRKLYVRTREGSTPTQAALFTRTAIAPIAYVIGRALPSREYTSLQEAISDTRLFRVNQ
jgi:hypothetical protein